MDYIKKLKSIHPRFKRLDERSTQLLGEIEKLNTQVDELFVELDKNETELANIDLTSFRPMMKYQKGTVLMYNHKCNIGVSIVETFRVEITGNIKYTNQGIGYVVQESGNIENATCTEWIRSESFLDQCVSEVDFNVKAVEPVDRWDLETYYLD